MQRCAATPLADLWVGAVFSSSLRLPWLLPGAVPHEHRVLACPAEHAHDRWILT
jgi:hypothetical protein